MSGLGLVLKDQHLKLPIVIYVTLDQSSEVGR